jgi:hypothetical protein
MNIETLSIEQLADLRDKVIELLNGLTASLRPSAETEPPDLFRVRIWYLSVELRRNSQSVNHAHFR